MALKELDNSNINKHLVSRLSMLVTMTRAYLYVSLVNLTEHILTLQMITYHLLVVTPGMVMR